jgi:hypothetical protein
MTSHDAILHTVKKKGPTALQNPLLNTTMLCIEGTAAIVRGEIENEGDLLAQILLRLFCLLNNAKLCIKGIEPLVTSEINNDGD